MEKYITYRNGIIRLAAGAFRIIGILLWPTSTMNLFAGIITLSGEAKAIPAKKGGIIRIRSAAVTTTTFLSLAAAPDRSLTCLHPLIIFPPRAGPNSARRGEKGGCL